MTTTPYQRRKAWIASLSPERKARHKAEMAARRQLARVYRPLKRGQFLARRRCARHRRYAGGRVFVALS